MDLAAGTIVDRYRIGHELGRGGVAVVYYAKHVKLESLHALKVVSCSGRSARERLLREGRVQSTVRHPNLVSVTDLVLFENMPVLVMEFVRGPSLAEFLNGYRPDRLEVDRIARGIFEGMIAAHHANLVHRDLKPGNVLLAIRNHTLVPKVADFGLVKILDGEQHAFSTRTGAVMGTPAYMAPEQLNDSSKVDARADVFAVGAVLYELVCGTRAFEAEDTVSLFNKVCAGDYRPVPELVPDVPARMVRAITGALEVDLNKRIPTVEALFDCWLTGSDGPIELPSIRRVPWTDAAIAWAEGLVPTIDESFMSTEDSAGSVAATFATSAETMDFESSIDAGEPQASSSAGTSSGSLGSLPTVGARRWPLAWMGIAVLVGIALGGAASLQVALRSQGPVTGTSEAEPAPLTRIAKPQDEVEAMKPAESRDVLGIEWLYIEEGCFLMGTNDSFSNERPVHEVCLPGFEFSRSEVTVAQYARCVKQGACLEPATESGCNWKQPDREDHPINCVSWLDARAFADWAHGRLPSEAEWEYAARSGGRDQVYPWGDQAVSCQHAVVKNELGDGCGLESTWPVCSKPDGHSSLGVCDLVGNVWEWTADTWHDNYVGSHEDGLPWTGEGDWKVNRGGCFLSTRGNLRSSRRHRDHGTGKIPNFGIRLARSR
jgi:serine/threonine-protein kinase